MAVYDPDQDRIRCGDHYLDPEVTVELYAVGNSDRPHCVTRVCWGQMAVIRCKKCGHEATTEDLTIRTQ